MPRPEEGAGAGARATPWSMAPLLRPPKFSPTPRPPPVLRLYYDVHHAVLDDRVVGSHRDHAGRQDDLTGANVESALVEVALDHVAFDKSLRQRPRSVRAGVVGDVERAVDVVHRDRQTGRLDFPRLP